HPVISAGASRRLEDLRQMHCGRRGTSGNLNAQLSTSPFEPDEIGRTRGASGAAPAEDKRRRLKPSPLSGTRREAARHPAQSSSSSSLSARTRSVCESTAILLVSPSMDPVLRSRASRRKSPRRIMGEPGSTEDISRIESVAKWVECKHCPPGRFEERPTVRETDQMRKLLATAALAAALISPTPAAPQGDDFDSLDYLKVASA